VIIKCVPTKGASIKCVGHTSSDAFAGRRKGRKPSPTIRLVMISDRDAVFVRNICRVCMCFMLSLQEKSKVCMRGKIYFVSKYKSIK